jgi:hypothetical protein
LSFQMQEILLLRFALPSALLSPNLRRSSVSSRTKIQFLERSPSATICGANEPWQFPLLEKKVLRLRTSRR